MTITQPVDITECRAAQFDALAHPVRLRLLRLITASGGNLSVVELTEQINSVKQSVIVYHLHRMRAAGILTCSNRGYFTYYALHLEALTDMQDELDRLLHQHTQAAAEARRV